MKTWNELIDEVIDRLKKLTKHEAFATYFGDAHHSVADDGEWIYAGDIEQLINDLIEMKK